MKPKFTAHREFLTPPAKLGQRVPTLSTYVPVQVFLYMLWFHGEQPNSVQSSKHNCHVVMVPFMSECSWKLLLWCGKRADHCNTFTPCTFDITTPKACEHSKRHMFVVHLHYAGAEVLEHVRWQHQTIIQPLFLGLSVARKL